MSPITLLDADARDLLALTGAFLADRVLWTTKARAARRYKARRLKPLRWRDDPAEELEVDLNPTLAKVSCSPLDRRAVEWSLLGALELLADDPNGPTIIRALDLLRAVSRGWTVARVEDALGHRWTLWLLATAVVRRPGLHLAPRAPTSPSPRLAPATPLIVEDPPETLRSSELRARRRRAA